MAEKTAKTETKSLTAGMPKIFVSKREFEAALGKSAPQPVKEPKEGEKVYAPKEPNAIEKILAGRKGFVIAERTNTAEEGKPANWKETGTVLKAGKALNYVLDSFGPNTRYRNLAIDESKLTPDLKAILPDAVALSKGRERQLVIAKTQATKPKGKEEVGAER